MEVSLEVKSDIDASDAEQDYFELRELVQYGLFIERLAEVHQINQRHNSPASEISLRVAVLKSQFQPPFVLYFPKFF
jgi:hypothetical protein